MISKVKKIVKKLLGLDIQPQQPTLGNAEKRLQELLKLEQEMLQRQLFVQRQRGANEKAKNLLASMKGSGLLPHQIEKLEKEFLLEDEKYAKEFRRILNGED